MSLNKNLKFSDYKEVIILPDSVGDNEYKFLSDVSGDITKRVVSSLFLKARYKNAPTSSNYFLILKPECLWLKLLSSSTVVDAYGNPEDKMIRYVPYQENEILKASFLLSPVTIQDIMIKQGFSLTQEPKALPLLFNDDITTVFMFDLNQLNRSRISGSGSGTSVSTISRWL